MASFRLRSRRIQVMPVGADDYSPFAPEIANDEHCSIVFDGVLYDLEAGADASATVLRRYGRSGADVLKSLRGIFFLTIWDEQNDCLLCARDPLGIYPFFYAVTDDLLLASPFIDALVADPRVPKETNRAALADRLLHRWANEPQETYFSAIRRLLPGHALLFGHSGVRVYRYWHATLPGEEVDWTTEEELERFPDLLAQAVDRCLSFGRAAVYLSGGLDSVAVTAVAADRSRLRSLPPPCTLSIVDLDHGGEERSVQVGVASQLGLPQTLVTASEVSGDGGLLPAALEICRTWALPVVNYWTPVHLRLGRRAAKDGCSVALTGDGGDEWLSAAPIYAADLLRKLDLVGLLKLWRDLQRSRGTTTASSLREVLWRSGARPVFRGVAHSAAPGLLAAYRKHGVLRVIPEWVAPDPLLRRELEERSIRSLGRPAKRDFLIDTRQQLLDRTSTSLDKEEAFERGRVLGLRVLKPFWDVDLVELLYRTPSDLLSRGGRSKRVAREMLERRFPGLGFERQRKFNYSSFVEPLLREEGRRAWRDMAGASALAELGIVDAQGARKAVEDALAQASPGQSAYRIWDILSLEAWLRSRNLGGG